MPDDSTENQPLTVEQASTGGEGTTQTTVAGGSGGIGGSTFTPVYGRREIKTYPITEEELGQLFGIGLSASLCFSIAIIMLGVAINIQLTISFLKDISNSNAIYWSTIKNIAWFISLILFLVGGLLTGFGKKRYNKIKSATKFEKNQESSVHSDIVR